MKRKTSLQKKEITNRNLHSSFCMFTLSQVNKVNSWVNKNMDN